MVAYLPTHTPIHYVQVVVHGARARAPSLSYTPVYEYSGMVERGKERERKMKRPREIKRAAVRLYPSTRGNGVERDSRVRVRVPGPS